MRNISDENGNSCNMPLMPEACGLKSGLTPAIEQYENICKNEFIQLHRKLDQLDEAIRGNGRPGIQVRLDRLEQEQLNRSKLGWFVFGAFCTAATTAITKIIMGLGLGI